MKKALGVVLIVIGIVVVAIVVGALIYNAPLPLTDFTAFDETVSGDLDNGTIRWINVRIENSGSVRASRITYRIDILGSDGTVIDGDEVILTDSFDPMSTRNVSESVVITGLPPRADWSWTGRITRAQR